MSEKNLPEEYRGFSTAELLAIWKSFPDRILEDPPIPDDKNDAWRALLREYALLDFGKDGKDAEKIKRCKRLLAPYGIDPAPWADENGIRQKELEDAWGERLMQESEARRQRNKARRQGK